ncbi:MAG: hypothetical protein A3C07_05165 [Candidatus Sungbacteria bacterium RIFCSPHIGHO2_02_FULL_47_11]|uniref:Uncharacterized protein n=1 Tax=Candidatus Sungbacteria bacterium RIFCSPHIGHO2_02_FULL_47_11 TaxID=1802270 RepID=A0A1G2KNH3_9BACT|nr:MAG: hypothetical protein A3C07_05165 [Candidatus Sungbacteria bacterium RIFCSPHIGHO2_02_FULL_47_11]
MDQNQLLETNIIEALGIELLPDDKKAKLVASMIDLVQKRIVVRLLEGLADGEAQKFAAIAESRDGAKLASWAGERGLDLEKITKEEVLRIKSELIERGNKIK